MTTNLENLTLKLRDNGENYTTLCLENGKWVFNRSHSGEEIIGVETDADTLLGIRRMPYSNNNEVTLTIVMDKYSVEIFENGNALTSTIYPPKDAINLTLTVKAKSCAYIKEEI